MVSRSIIRLQRIIDLQDYFAITEFNNCFIIGSLSLFSNEYPREVKCSATFMWGQSQEGEKCSLDHFNTHEQNAICSQTQLDNIAHEQTIICEQLFAGHMVASRPMKRKKHLLWMISKFGRPVLCRGLLSVVWLVSSLAAFSVVAESKFNCHKYYIYSSLLLHALCLVNLVAHTVYIVLLYGPLELFFSNTNHPEK